jgi:hypothetical protein
LAKSDVGFGRWSGFPFCQIRGIEVLSGLLEMKVARKRFDNFCAGRLITCFTIAWILVFSMPRRLAADELLCSTGDRAQRSYRLDLWMRHLNCPTRLGFRESYVFYHLLAGGVGARGANKTVSRLL